MSRIFDKNMFIMLLSIMIGVIIITFFIADIMRRSDIEELEKEHIMEIQNIEKKNLNFTSSFLSSMGDLDRARENRAEGNYYFELASIWYSSAWSEINESKMNTYKISSIDNCENALIYYKLSYNNFLIAKSHFEITKELVDYDYNFLNLLDLYMNLSGSAANLSNLRIQSSIYLEYLAENITMVEGRVEFLINMTDIQDLYNQSIESYNIEFMKYNEIDEEIEKEYDIFGFSEDRELY